MEIDFSQAWASLERMLQSTTARLPYIAAGLVVLIASYYVAKGVRKLVRKLSWQRDAEIEFKTAHLIRGMHCHRLGNQMGVRNDNPPAVVRAQGCRPCLNILNSPLELSNFDLIVDAEWLGKKQDHASKVVLKHIAEGKAESNSADAEELDHLRRSKRGQGDHERHE